MSSATHNDYYIPEPSRWPIIAATGVFTILFGVVMWMNGIHIGPWIMLGGALIVAFLFKGWFGDVITENLKGNYNDQVDRSFRQGMFWFITSEVFFFLTFFGCLYYLRNITLPYLGGEGHLAKSHMLWESFKYTWPVLQLPDASGYIQPKEAMGAGGIPLWNTIILLSSGGTLTWAHWGLKKSNKTQLVVGLALTVGLGALFFSLQAYEYGHAYHEMDLTLHSGIYGSTFYLLTGFHGLHVTIGALMLAVILGRAMKDHFSPHNHFAFEGVAWYWHFVDVVWLGLYVFVYWL
jgi:cytochrome c oxidase subunit 3